MKNDPRTERSIAALVAVAISGVWVMPVPALSAEMQLAVDVGVGTSDNILRSFSDPRSETIEQLGLQFSLQNQSSRMITDIRGDLAFLNYDKNTYSSEIVGNAGASFRFGLVEDRLTWSLDEVFGQTRRDPFAVITPLNSEDVNYVSTGPNALFRIGGTDRIFASARYGKVTFETSLYNTDRFHLQAGYQHDLSSVSQLGLNLSHERVDPQNGGSLFSPYAQQEVYARYSLGGARTKAGLDFGFSRVDRSGLANDGVLFRLNLSRKIDDISTVSLKAGRQISDAGGSLAWSGDASLPTAGYNTQSLSRTANPFASTYAGATWTLNGRRTHIALGGSVFDERYASTPQLDRKRYEANIYADRVLTTRLTTRASFSYNKYDFSSGSFNNDNRYFDLGLNWRLGRHMSLDLSAQKTRFGSRLTANSLDESRIWFKAKYTK